MSRESPLEYVRKQKHMQTHMHAHTHKKRCFCPHWGLVVEMVSCWVLTFHCSGPPVPPRALPQSQSLHLIPPSSSRVSGELAHYLFFCSGWMGVYKTHICIPSVENYVLLYHPTPITFKDLSLIFVTSHTHTHTTHTHTHTHTHLFTHFHLAPHMCTYTCA